MECLKFVEEKKWTSQSSVVSALEEPGSCLLVVARKMGITLSKVSQRP